MQAFSSFTVPNEELQLNWPTTLELASMSARRKSLPRKHGSETSSGGDKQLERSPISTLHVIGFNTKHMYMR